MTLWPLSPVSGGGHGWGLEVWVFKLSPELVTKTTRDIDQVVKRIDGAPGGLVVIDGCRQAGKSHLASEIALRLPCPSIEIDAFWDKEKPGYVEAIRISDLRAQVDEALSKSTKVLLNGICARAVIRQIEKVGCLFVYVLRVSQAGIPSNIEWLDAEESKPTNLPHNELDQEIMLYHWQYKPCQSADLILARHAQ